MRIHNYAANEDTFKFAFASFWMSCKQAVAQPLECWSIEEALDNAAGKTGVLLSNPDGKGTHWLHFSFTLLFFNCNDLYVDLHVYMHARATKYSCFATNSCGSKNTLRKECYAQRMRLPFDMSMDAKGSKVGMATFLSLAANNRLEQSLQFAFHARDLPPPNAISKFFVAWKAGQSHGPEHFPKRYIEGCRDGSAKNDRS